MEGDGVDEDWMDTIRKLSTKETRTEGYTIFNLKKDIPKSFRSILEIEKGERLFRIYIWKTIHPPTIIKFLSKVDKEGFITPVIVIQTLGKKDVISFSRKMNRAEFEMNVDVIRKAPYILLQTEDCRDFSICKDAKEVIERVKKWRKV